MERVIDSVGERSLPTVACIVAKMGSLLKRQLVTCPPSYEFDNYTG